MLRVCDQQIRAEEVVVRLHQSTRDCRGSELFEQCNVWRKQPDKVVRALL